MNSDKAIWRRGARARIVAPTLLVLVAMSTLPVLAQSDGRDQDADPWGGNIFSVKRIEVTGFAGLIGGATILDLPIIPSYTNDTGDVDVLDFDGDPLVQGPKYANDIDGARKKIEDGIIAGVTAAFFLGESFGIELLGAYGQTEGVVTGQVRNAGLTGERFEWNRANMKILMAGGNMFYLVGTRKLRPFVSLGFGGIINRFDRIEDVTALYFQWGGGLVYPLSDRLQARLSVNSTLFTYATDEVAFDETIQYPQLNLGITWRYMVPPPSPDEIESAAGGAAGRPDPPAEAAGD